MAMLAASTNAFSAGPEDVLDSLVGVMKCTGTKDDPERLRCYDAAVVTLRTAGVADAPKTADTKEVVASFSPSDYKLVDPDDMHVAPRKFVGKPVELRNAKCFYADKDDYRCLGSSRSMITTIFAKDVGPSAEKDALENDCGAIKKLESPLCRRTIRFVPRDYDQDAPNAFAKRIVMRAATIEIVPAPRARR
jgi:hypothetical protein